MQRRTRNSPVPVTNLHVKELRHLLLAFTYNVDVDVAGGGRGWTLGGSGTVRFKLGESLVACDPYLVRGARAFRRKLIPGQHFVRTFDVHVNGREQPVTAFAAIHHIKARFAQVLVARFELALFEEAEGEGKAEEPRRTGYPVDHATGCFCSAEARDAVASSPQEYARLCRAMEAPVPVTTHKSSGGTIGAFPTGFGDGNYRSYWAFDAKGETLGLITDLGVVTGASAAKKRA